MAGRHTVSSAARKPSCPAGTRADPVLRERAHDHLVSNLRGVPHQTGAATNSDVQKQDDDGGSDSGSHCRPSCSRRRQETQNIQAFKRYINDSNLTKLLVIKKVSIK
ncbi:hypothetical protein evm_014659 [Chilo suppressalis]|nr:hypothetical protein evm_014659 [Chilo suppressalis]